MTNGAPVRFDDGAAETARLELLRAGQTLLEVTARLAEQVAATAEGWEGPHRQRFDDAVSARLVEGDVIGTVLVHHAGTVLAGQARAAGDRLALAAALDPTTPPPPPPPPGPRPR